MKILFDQGTPAPLRHALAGNEVATTYETGWEKIANGELLNVAEEQSFEILVTTDKNIRYQQNLTGRKIAIFVLPFASWPRLQAHAAVIAHAIAALPPGSYLEWSVP